MNRLCSFSGAEFFESNPLYRALSRLNRLSSMGSLELRPDLFSERTGNSVARGPELVSAAKLYWGLE